MKDEALTALTTAHPRCLSGVRRLLGEELGELELQPTEHPQITVWRWKGSKGTVRLTVGPDWHPHTPRTVARLSVFGETGWARTPEKVVYL